VALATSEVRRIVERACARQDVLDACARRDLGTVITVLGAHGLPQQQISAVTGISQGRLSEWVTGKRQPKAATTFESFANGLGMPQAARQALGLAAETTAGASMSAVRAPAADLDTGLQYPGTPLQAADTVSVLWKADLADQAVLDRGLVTPRRGAKHPCAGSSHLPRVPAAGNCPAGSASGRATWNGSAPRWRCSSSSTTASAAATHATR
jgi:transcriptional regulator with XRE-family HTH domain